MAITQLKMDSRGCLGVLCDHKNRTFAKVHQTYQKLNFKAQKRPMTIHGKMAKNTIFSPKILFLAQKLPVFISIFSWRNGCLGKMSHPLKIF